MNSAVEQPEAVGMNARRLERIRPTMQAYVDRGVYAGIATLVARRGKVVHAEEFGWRDKEAKVAMTADTIFRLYSMTKPIICTALMTLLEEGRFRLSDKVDLKYNVHGDGSLLRIAPLLMIPFVENAFKYGVSTREKSYIGIDIQIKENVVTLNVVNTKHSLSPSATMDNTGIGINNARRRLTLLYPGKHELDIRDEAATFSVMLKINCG